MIDLSAVLRAIGRALEILTASGTAKAGRLTREEAGWTDYTGNDLEAALDIQQALLSLPIPCHLAVMWQFTKDNPRLGERYLNDLVSETANQSKERERYGREVLHYWVRHWARHDGRYREAARLFGRSDMTHRRFYLDELKPQLDSWLIHAKGELETVMAKHDGFTLSPSRRLAASSALACHA